MFSLKKSIIPIMMFTAVLFTITPAMAYTVDITISNLSPNQELAAFDLNVNFNNDLLKLDSYELTKELGSFTNPDDAQDWSLGNVAPGTVNLAVMSYRSDFSSQPNNFTLAKLSFIGDESAIDSISLSNIVLSDASGHHYQAGDFSYSGTSINMDLRPAPIPGAIWLLGTGLGVVTIRRKSIT
jgi:hypothetical protein